jgi:tetratricopeptide (TPR) repeat protein
MSPEQSPHKIGKSVGEKLRAARVAQHYTQSQLAAPDFSVSYISAIERGQIHPSLRALEILAGRLGMTSTQLLPNKAQQEERAHIVANLSEQEEEEIELDLLDMQIQIVQGNAEQTFKPLEQLNARRLKRNHQLKQRYLLGWAYYKTARYQESEYTLSEATQIAKELNEYHINLHILHQLALTYAAMRNYAQALLAHQRCLKLLEESDIQDPFFVAQIYIHMGQHHTCLDHVEQALEMYHKALSITEELTTLQSIQIIYSNLCQYYVVTKQKDLAIFYADKSMQIKNQEMMKRRRSELHYYLGRAIMRGDALQARKYLDETLPKQELIQDKLALASVLVRDAEWHFNQGNYEQAATIARQAHELAQPFADTLITADTLIMLGRIEYATQHNKEGEQHFVAGLNMLDRLQSHEELANESVRYAELLEKIGQEREAFVHFRRAFQSKQKLGK